MTTTIEDAARILRSGGVVAFPTETVYGLGANALDPQAVRRIYEQKGRPATSPLIVHVSSIEMARSLSSAWPTAAEELALRYWPGPLSIVVPKIAAVPDEVTSGLPTVGLRIPRHPVALQLLALAGVPVAAPSANKFTEVSPTTAQHVRDTFGDAVPVVDGGPCDVGIESTVVAVSATGKIQLLRPGMLQIPEAVIAEIESKSLSPGLHPKHYSPKRTRVMVGTAAVPGSIYVWHTQQLDNIASLQLPKEPSAYAAKLYAVLHDLDAQGYTAIVFEPLPEDPAWDALRDRLHRASVA
ncbi:threonylcarbamoyl-AMP synthase [Bryobacterales bacterium F-183]|nr:threonylcarbamoyl-AMP synthase [Bryobacterales bacterium F-183]